MHSDVRSVGWLGGIAAILTAAATVPAVAGDNRPDARVYPSTTSLGGLATSAEPAAPEANDDKPAAAAEAAATAADKGSEAKAADSAATEATEATAKAAAPATGESVTTGALPKSDAAAKSDAPASSAPKAAEEQVKAATATPEAATSEAKPSAVPAMPGSGSVATAAADPIVAAVQAKLASPDGGTDADDVAAMTAFYADRIAPVWVEKSGFNGKAKAAIGEVRKADDWGLSASAFEIPAIASDATAPEALAEGEVKLGLELLKYARFARGGRVNPQSLSRIMDMTPQIKDPKLVYAELAGAASPDAYLRGLHPQHPEFEKLRQALLKARGPAPVVEDKAEVDPALLVKLPDGNLIRPGADHAQVALLRQRLKIAAEDGAQETVYDPALVEAVKTFQREKGLKANGIVTNGTRRALNREGAPAERPTPEASETRILVNMERWRWIPEDMGALHVWDNIPEFIARVRKGGKEIFKERIIVGLPAWATPVFSADMKTIVFNPSWGVPDGIKTRELLPRLRQAGGGFFFFGGGGGGSIIRAYGFQAYRGGRLIDPDSVDWSNVDIRSFSFVQPPGGKNPLGVVKFMFPNKHDVYMHDTIERSLFAQSHRAYSHGCIRVQNPLRLAAVLLAEDRGYSEDEAQDAISRGGEVALKTHIPVHVTYFTARVDDDGKLVTFSDIYGQDSRLASALTGRSLPYDASSMEVSDATAGDPAEVSSGPVRKKRRAPKGPETLSDVISGFWNN